VTSFNTLPLGFKISPITNSPDISRILSSLETLLFINPWSESQLAVSLSQPHSRSLQLTLNDSESVIGYLIGVLVEQVGEIYKIGIVKEMRGRGLAKSLLGQWLTGLFAEGASEARLEVAADNNPAIALYRGFSFVESRRRIGYYRNGVDAVEMVLTKELYFSRLEKVVS